MHGARGSLPLTALWALLAAALLLLGSGPAQAAVLPAALTGAWRGPRALAWWLGGEGGGPKQMTLGDDGGADRHDGLRWTSRGFAALGDSYSAGIGTHLDGKEESCRLGLGAYPALLHADLGANGTGVVRKASGKKNKGKDGDGDGGDDITTFQWLSCTGATTANILGTSPPPPSSLSIFSSSSALASPGQIDALVTDPAAAALDFVTLSIGGNDLGFFDVINACVFRFYGYYSGTCEAALRTAEALVADDDDEDDDPASFSARLTVILLQLLERVRWEKRPRFRVVVTGYARFFNAETDTCDRCSMSVWWHYGNATGVPPNATDTTYLTRPLRRRMNDLVAGTNRKLRAVVGDVNARFAAEDGAPPRILFVDYDAAFDGHRFCEPGVVEPDYERDDTWFFLVGGADNNQTKAEKSGGHDVAALATLPPGSPLVDPDRCRAPAEARGDWGERALCDLVQAQAADPDLLPAVLDGAGVDDSDADRNGHGNGRLVSPQSSMWYVPTYYGKTFHPRSNGHLAIRDSLYQVWEENGV